MEFDSRLDLPDRKGSDVDASSLFQRFQELGFDSDLLNDASDEDITEKFNESEKFHEVKKKTIWSLYEIHWLLYEFIIFEIQL
jgi:hypothetical protein